LHLDCGDGLAGRGVVVLTGGGDVDVDRLHAQWTGQDVCAEEVDRRSAEGFAGVVLFGVWKREVLASGLEW
jgi:hypothetical protein